jgi:hypothetical protein
MGGFNDHPRSDRDLVSRADEVDNWGKGKKFVPSAAPPSRGSSGSLEPNSEAESAVQPVWRGSASGGGGVLEDHHGGELCLLPRALIQAPHEWFERRREPLLEQGHHIPPGTVPRVPIMQEAHKAGAAVRTL